MSKKTFISNQELELTQKIQLQFPRGVIPSEVLKYWENCPPDVLRLVLRDAFYLTEKVNDPIIKVRRPIPFKLPHSEDLTGSFYYPQNFLSERDLFFNINDVNCFEAREISTKLADVLEIGGSYNHLDVFQLWAIYLRGPDFFLKYFLGIIYALKSAFRVNNDVYIPGIHLDHSTDENKLQIDWYSSCNNFSFLDHLLVFK